MRQVVVGACLPIVLFRPAACRHWTAADAARRLVLSRLAHLRGRSTYDESTLNSDAAVVADFRFTTYVDGVLSAANVHINQKS